MSLFYNPADMLCNNRVVFNNCWFFVCYSSQNLDRRCKTALSAQGCCIDCS